METWECLENPDQKVSKVKTACQDCLVPMAFPAAQERLDHQETMVRPGLEDPLENLDSRALVRGLTREMWANQDNLVPTGSTEDKGIAETRVGEETRDPREQQACPEIRGIKACPDSREKRARRELRAFLVYLERDLRTVNPVGQQLMVCLGEGAGRAGRDLRGYLEPQASLA